MEHIERRHCIVLAGAIERIFPLFTPVGETSWVAGWNPDFLYPADGRTCEGMVFRTGAGDEATLWCCIDWQPKIHRVRYARVTPASRFGIVEVVCRELPDAQTEATVAYAYTSLSETGQSYLEELTESAFADMIDGWRSAIDDHLSQREYSDA